MKLFFLCFDACVSCKSEVKWMQNYQWQKNDSYQKFGISITLCLCVYMTARGGSHQPTHINKWNCCACLINTDKSCGKNRRTIERFFTQSRTSRRTVVSDWRDWTQQSDRPGLIFFVYTITLISFLLFPCASDWENTHALVLLFL